MVLSLSLCGCFSPKNRIGSKCSGRRLGLLMAWTKDQCTQLNIAVVYPPKRNKDMYVHTHKHFIEGKCIILCIQNATCSVSGSQTLVQCVQNVERPPSSKLPPCPLSPTATETGVKGGQAQKKASSLSPHMHEPLTATGSRVQTIY